MEMRYPPTFEAPIHKVDDYMCNQLDDNSSFIAQAIRDLIIRDKNRIRSSFTLSVGEMLEADSEHLFNLTAAVEMLHIANRIHEGLIENGSLRRGYKVIGADWHPGAIVLAGDLVFAQASRLAAKTESTLVMEMFAQTLATISNGDVTQLFSNGSRFNHRTYLQWIYAKIASVFELAAGATARLAGVGDERFQLVSQLGKSFGMAYQILDDVADFLPNGSNNAQNVASTLKQGVITLPVLYYSQANPDDPDLELLKKSASQKNGSLDRLFKAISQSGALSKSLQEVQNYIHQYLQILVQFPISPSRLALEELANGIMILVE